MSLEISEKQQQSWKRSNELHEKYRATGLALSLTIVGISGGALNVIRPQDWRVSGALFLPIALAIVHQACLFMGQKHEALASWAWYIATMHLPSMAAAEKDETRRRKLNKDMDDAADRGWHHNTWGVRWFKLSDWLCLLAVASFIAVGFVAVTRLPQPAIQAGIGP